MAVTNLAINKKGTRVVITGKPKFYNLEATFVQYAPVLGYIGWRFDMFTFDNSGYAVTGWGITAIVILFLAFRSKIKEKIKEYDDTFGETWKRSKAGSASLAIATVLLVIYALSMNLFIVFGIFSASTYLSLFLYKPYDELSIKRKTMQKMLDEENQKKDFDTIKNEYLEIKNI